MQPRAPTRFIDPALLAGISHLDLVAKTVVDGFVAGVHRSPDFGFSQEFAEYRSYTPGDDLRHVDWNVFARTERMYLKRYRGETNCQLNVLLDTSRSMKFTSHKIEKFEDEVRHFVQPSTRQGQLHRLLHGIEKAEPGTRTDFSRPFAHLGDFLKK